MDNQQLEEELGILRSIFGDEVSISEQTQDGIRSQVSMQLFPSTADDESKKHVCVTVVFTISPTYPKEKPVVELDSVRGLNQQLEKELMVKLDELLESRLEGAMLFDAIDLIKEFLTCHNHPSVECAICLETMSSDYHEFSSFVKTDCFHYFHPWCLSEYLKSTQVIVQDENTDPNETPGGGCVGHVCPICRTELSLTVEYLDSFERPPDAESDRTPDAQPIELGEEFRKFQQQMQQLLEKQKEQGGTVDASTTSNVVIDVSAASRKSPQNSSSSSDQPSSSTIDGHSTDDTGGNLTSKGDPVAPKLEETQNRLSNQPNLDMKPGSFVSRRGYTKNLNSSYPLNSTFRRTNSKEVSNDFRPRNLSASYSAGSGTNEQAARIDHKYHDGRWRPRKKHDFEIRAELLEKSRSLDDQNSAIDLSEEQEISAAVENKVKTSNSSEGVPNERTSNVPNQSSASKQSSKDSVNETEVRHSNLHHTVSNPVPDVTTPAYNPPRTDPMTQPPTRRIKKKPPLSLPSKANFPGNHNYAEGEYYSQYGYDYRGSEHWYYGGGVNNAANSNESFYSANNPEIYSRNRHSYHGNNKRGKTGYQGRKGHSSGYYYQDQGYFDASTSYDWERWRVSGSFSAQPSPKISPRGPLKPRLMSSNEHESFEEGSPDYPLHSSMYGPYSAGGLVNKGGSAGRSRNGSLGTFMVVPNSPMLQPMPVMPAPSSSESGTTEHSDGSSVFTYYNGPASASATNAPPGFAYPMF